jgi:sulfate adenylyltransferase subunit 2
MNKYRLTHLKQLESESIDIIREAYAQSERPVMLYSIGKDSSVMIRLAQKAFIRARYRFLFFTSILLSNSGNDSVQR